MRFLIILIFLIFNSFAIEASDIKNLVINKDLKKYEDLTFLDDQNNQIDLSDYKGNLILLNFWATWCAPCKEEMPSLDSLQDNKDLNNLKIFPINVGQDNIKKASEFFEDLGIKNLKLYFDSPITAFIFLGTIFIIFPVILPRIIIFPSIFYPCIPTRSQVRTVIGALFHFFHNVFVTIGC